MKDTMKKNLYKWLPIIMGCHCKKERSFFIGNEPFPVCARCTGELCGILIGAITFSLFNPSLLYLLFMTVPMLLDGGIQYFSSYESNNPLRFITGSLFGYAVWVMFGKSIVWVWTAGWSFGRCLSF